MPDSDPITALADQVRRLADAIDAQQAEGLDASAAAKLAGVGVSKWHQLNADGLCPAPAEIGSGRCPRWSRGELIAWIRSGAVSRSQWRFMRDAEMRKVG